ncbi:MAG: hypothetical protein OEZ59_08060 [Deltaproteobacteria bacterium]|nr:hypothetical protein [Deltaproteobacteria bacterium]
MKRSHKKEGGFMSLDSLVDIVSNNVGILIILAAFMALMALFNPNMAPEKERLLIKNPPRRLLVPWSHATNKNQIYFSLRGNRLQLLDLKEFYWNLARHEPGETPQPLELQLEGLDVKFFPVTNQIYCLEFNPRKGAGETWIEANKPGSRWLRTLEEYPPEHYTLFFWVEGEAFGMFREIREYLWQRNFEVGWKPSLRDDRLELCNGFEGSTAFQPQ